jgi:hypothetical protein
VCAAPPVRCVREKVDSCIVKMRRFLQTVLLADGLVRTEQGGRPCDGLPPALGEVLQIVEERKFYFFSINFRSRRTSIKTRPSSTQTADKNIITYLSNGISRVPPIFVPWHRTGLVGSGTDLERMLPQPEINPKINSAELRESGNSVRAGQNGNSRWHASLKPMLSHGCFPCLRHYLLPCCGERFSHQLPW